MTNRIRGSHVQLGQSLVVGEFKKEEIVPAETPEEVEAREKAEREEVRKKEEAEFKKTLEEMLVDAKEQARVVVEKAEQRAAEIEKTAEEEAAKRAQEAEELKEQAIKNGYEEGFQKGTQEGIVQAGQEITEKIWGVDTLTSAAFSIKKEIINSAEKEILELSITIAEKIIKKQLELKPEFINEIIKSAIANLKDKEEIKIIINPALTQNLYDFKEELQEEIRGLKTIKIVEDKTIPKDGVIVESPDSRIDGRIETQLQEIIKNLMNEYTEKSNSEGISEEIEIRIDDRASNLKKKEPDSDNNNEKNNNEKNE